VSTYKLDPLIIESNVMVSLDIKDTHAEGMEGEVRHIARTYQAVESLREKQIERDWLWVVKMISLGTKRAMTDTSGIPLPDTVLIQERVLTCWLYYDGGLKLKGDKIRSYKGIRKHFQATQHPEAFARYVNHLGERGFVSKSNLERIQNGTIQAVIEGKTDANFDGAYTVEFSLQHDGRHQMNCFKLGAIADTVSQTLREPIRSRDQVLNKMMINTTTNLLRLIEVASHSKISKITVEFTVDQYNCIWIRHTSKLLATEPKLTVLALEPLIPDFVPPTNILQRSKVHEESIQEANDDSEYAFTLKSMGLDSQSCLTDIADAALYRVDKRSHPNTLHKKRPRDPALLQPAEEIQNPIAIQRKSGPFRKIYTLYQDPLVDPLKTVSDSLGKKTDTQFESSQNSACPGDFCDIQVQFNPIIDDQEIDSISGTKIAFEMKTDISDKKRYSVSYKAVAQARAEKPLVELLIKRMQKNLDGKYTESYSDISMNNFGTTYPIHYYHQVQVCQQCFKMYQKIESSRQKALQNLEQSVKPALKQIRSPEQIPSYNDTRIHPYSDEAKEMMNKSQEELQAIALTRAKRAIAHLTKSDIAEFRSFKNPPSAVRRVCQALMLLLTGKELSWEASKRVVANGDRFIGLLMDFDSDCISAAKMTELEPFLRDTSFRPAVLHPISKSAGVLCEYVLGNIQANKFKNHIGHARSDPLLFLPSFIQTPVIENQVEHQKQRLDKNGSQMISMPNYLQNQMSRVQSLNSLRTPSTNFESLQNKLDDQRKQIRSRKGGRTRPNSAEYSDPKMEPLLARRPNSSQAHAPLELHVTDSPTESELLSPTGYSRVQNHALAGTTVAFNRHDSSPVSATITAVTREIPCVDIENPLKIIHDHLYAGTIVDPTLPESKKPSRREAQARKKVQAKQMERLHGSTNDPSQTSSDTTCSTKTFTCKDGISTMCYDIVGTGGVSGNAPNLVFVHDFFDTFEAIQIYMEPIMRRHPGSQALVFNYPGQAHTNFSEKSVLNNEFIAACMHELFFHLEQEGEFSTTIRPFYLCGIGNGVTIASYFALEYGTKVEYEQTLGALVSLNGFTHVDQQLAAVLHSSVNVFSCFPPARPDLPVSYFTRFLFSDEYLKKVDPNLVLNVYTAVGNPITLQGRVQICNGALRHKDIAEKFKAVRIPVILLQSTENVLVNATNVDPFLESRTVSHLWSHQLSEGGKIGSKGVSQIQHALHNPRTAFVLWLKAGHEVRQESKTQVHDFLEALLSTVPPPIVVKMSNKQEPKTSAPVPKQMPVQKIVQKAEPIIVQEQPALIIEPEEETEFTRALVRHKQVKKQAEDARRKRMDEMEIKMKQEEQEMRHHVNHAEELRIQQKKERRKQYETEVEIQKLAHEAEIQKRIAAKESEILENVEQERLKAEQIAAQLSKQLELSEQRAVQMKQELMQRAHYIEKMQRKEPTPLKGHFDDSDILHQIELLKKEQEERRRQWEEDDMRKINKLERELQLRKGGNQPEEAVHYIITDASTSKTVLQTFKTVEPLPSAKMIIENATDKVSQNMESKNQSQLDAEEFNRVKNEMMNAHLRQEELEEQKKRSNELKLHSEMALRIQKLARGRQGRRKFTKVKFAKYANNKMHVGATTIQALCRGNIDRERVAAIRVVALKNRCQLEAVQLIQRVYRGMQGRRIGLVKRQLRASIKIQSAIRMFIARCRVEDVRAEYERILREAISATKIQSIWRMHSEQDAYYHSRIVHLAALNIQRVYRGSRGRRKTARKQMWAKTQPGPERLQLGLDLIQESKSAFTSQQDEIDALHRAQERAETRVSKIHAGLKESEKELSVLEQELQDMDHLEHDLHELAHEKAIHDAKARAEESKEKKNNSIDSEAARKRAAESYALEMAIHIKRAERERKKKELEAEFAAVFQQVELKKSELSSLESSIQDMETTRRRKEREFQRLQRNLMELLQEQKHELDNLREKGIELETATATSAAAAAATAAAAKENEEKSKEMFNSTEELLKFQFMSMSLSYFSSINMLKSLRDINSDTTNAAVASSAQTAAAAAAAAQAANIPAIQNMMNGGEPSVATLNEREKKMNKMNEIEQAKRTLEKPFPLDIRKWTVEDVCRWLDTLYMSQYTPAFREACIDGEFLLELRCEDMRDVLGMKHSLHVQKVDIARNKLRPLNEEESRQKMAVIREERGEQLRQREAEEPIPDVESVFSQIRNGRLNRVEKALDAGFDPNELDSHGNSALIIASQNLHKRIIELLINRGANINHQNGQGNTAMHYAMSYETEGAIGEYLIGKGADDTLENKLGLSPYDGIE